MAQTEMANRRRLAVHGLRAPWWLDAYEVLCENPDRFNCTANPRSSRKRVIGMSARRVFAPRPHPRRHARHPPTPESLSSPCASTLHLHVDRASGFQIS
jgi:hypothetical protein